MPWRCLRCCLDFDDDVRDCSACGDVKSAWTVQGNSTRKMVVARKQFTCLRGRSTLPAASAADYDAAEWQETEVVHAVRAATVRVLLENGRLPSPSDLLVVRLEGGGKEPKVELTLLFGGQPARTLDLFDADQKDARFLLVYGGALDALDVPGVHVVDVAEGAAFAPKLAVAALKKPRKTLGVVADRELTLVLQNPFGQPIPEARFVATLADGKELAGRVDLEGRAVLDCPDGPVTVTYPDPDDLVAKADAGAALRALEAKDKAALVQVLRHGHEVGPLLRAAYDTYFNKLSGKGLLEDIQATFPTSLDRFHLGIVLAHLGLPIPGVTVVAPPAATPRPRLRDQPLAQTVEEV